jgi:uncharacterized protein YktB (UPF0637 family)
MSTDSFKIEENQDGTFAISWDQTDPEYAFLNDLTEEQLNAMFTEAIKRAAEESDEPVQ